MKKILSMLWVLMLSMAGWAQNTGEYNPENPADPDVFYRLTLEASPLSGGTVSTYSGKSLSAGQSCSVSASPRLGYVFKHWMMGDEVVSTNSNFTFTMPEHDAVLTAYFEWSPDYNPENPSDPDAEGYSHKVRVYAVPSAGGYFNTSSFTLLEGSTTNIYAYPREGYRFESWMVNGEVVSTDNPLNIRMGTSDMSYTATFTYNPVSPGEPSPNVFNAATGEVVIDNFTPGSLNSALSATIGGSDNYALVQSITVIGRMQSSDFGFARNCRNCSMVDLSRTTGYTEVPSWSFDGAESLKELYLPMNVEHIGTSAFTGCTALKDIYLYAVTPPTLAENALTGLGKGVSIHVPSSAVALFAAADGWNRLNIQSLDQNEKSVTVNLPGAAGTYKNMTLELHNMQSGQVYRCLVTDRTSYTFFGLMRDTYYSVYLKNSSNVVLGELANIALEDKNLAVNLDKIRSVHDVTLSVLTPDGSNVTADVTVTWLDEKGNHLRQGNKVSELLEGANVRYQLKLGKDLAMEYVQPEAMAYEVKEGNNAIQFTLSPLKQITLSGCVKDVATKQGISGASVSISQTLNGKYSKTIIVKTDNKGNYSATVYNAPTSLAVSAYDYVNQMTEVAVDPSSESVAADDILLSSIIGATINLNLTYTPSVAEGETAETQNWYDDYQNVVYSLYNMTTGKSLTQVSVRYPQLVVLDGVKAGDRLKITASSKKDAFMPVDVEAVVDSINIVDVTIPILEYGRIQASYLNSENEQVVGVLYDGSGRLIKAYDYESGSVLTIDKIKDGNYTLLTMGKNMTYNSIYYLSRAHELLLESVDFRQNTFTIESGRIQVIQTETVPYFEEDKFLYIDREKSYFRCDNGRPVVGNYLTLVGSIVFSDADLSAISNQKFVVDLPPSMHFVENSVMIGDQLISNYQLDGNTLIIPYQGHVTEKIKFCVVPSESGDFSLNALLMFRLNMRETAIAAGNASLDVKNISISVPPIVSDANLQVSGSSSSAVCVDVYDGNVLIGHTVPNANGTWSAACTLNEPYNLSPHPIHAVVTTSQGLTMQSETKTTMLDQDFIGANMVTMSYYNGWYKKNFSIVFDFQNQTTSANSYMFYHATDFTFVADLTNNDPSVVSAVTFYVYTNKNEVKTINAQYDSVKNRWVGIGYFDSNSLPTSVNVGIRSVHGMFIDRSEFNLKVSAYDEKRAQMSLVADSVDTILKNSERDSLISLQRQQKMESILVELGSDDANADSLLCAYMQLAGLEVSESEFTPVSSGVTVAFNRAEDLLAKPEEEFDETQYEDFLSQVSAILNNTKASFDYETSLKTAYNDTINIETENGPMSMYRGTLDDFDMNVINITDTIVMAMTDDTKVHLYTSDNDELLVIDSLNNSVMVFKHSGFVSQARVVTKGLFSGVRDFVSTMNDIREKVSTLEASITSALKALIGETNDHLTNLRKALSDIEDTRAVLLGEQAGRKMRIAEIEKEINNISAYTYDELINANKTISDKYRIIENLKAERSRIMKNIEGCDKSISKLNVKANSAQAKIISGLAVLGTLQDAWDLANSLKTTVQYIAASISDFHHWQGLINAIVPCPGDIVKASELKRQCDKDWNDIAWHKGYYPAFGLTGLTTLVNGYMLSPAGRGARIVAQVIVGTLTDFLNNTAERMFTSAQQTSLQLYPIRYAEYRNLTCKKNKDPKDTDEPDIPDNPTPSTFSSELSLRPIMDPAGYVYEGVSSNRLQGVTATAYYKETTEDMYGVLHEEARVWDAAEYAQENPLFTDENGMYQWFVPQGMWQVKFEKEGYETTYSEWLPVPPPQLEVNVAMTQARQPEVKRAHAYEDGVEVEFDKYMLPSLLTADNILVSQNGQYVEGEVKMLNEETAYRDDNVKYVSKVRFVPKVPFTAKEVTLTVANRVKSYAGIQMQDTYQQTFDIEKELKEIKVESELSVTTSKGHTLLVEVLPAATSSGKTLTVKSSSDMIVTTDAKSYTLDSDGKASVVVKGELPGTAALTFSVEGYDLSATTTVSVNLPVNDFCAAPIASVASGSKVTPGTEIRLSCATDDAVIYYTLDGSCPCDESDARKIYDGTPIIINEAVTIKTMAVAEGIGESDVVEFTYTIKKESLKYYTYESLVQTLEDREEWTNLRIQKPNAVAVVESAQAEWASQQKNVLVKNSNGSYTCADFLLTDLSQGYSSNASEAAKTGFFTPVSFKVTKGTYKRQAYAGYNTLCLPFSFKASELSSSAKVFTFDAYDTDKTKVVFKAVRGTIAAGMPCIVKEKADVVWTVDLSGKTFEAAQPSEESHMRGTYVTTDLYQGKGYSPRSSDNKFAPLTQYLHPFRACFSVSDLNDAGARGIISAIFLDEDGVTVIDEINAAGGAADTSKTIYTLSGQRISEVKRSGIYIVNGEKQYIEVK